MSQRWQVLIEKRQRQQRRVRRDVAAARSAERQARAALAELDRQNAALVRRSQNVWIAVAAEQRIPLNRCRLATDHRDALLEQIAALDAERVQAREALSRCAEQRDRMVRAYVHVTHRLDNIIEQRDRVRRRQRLRMSLAAEEQRVEDWRLTGNPAGGDSGYV